MPGTLKPFGRLLQALLALLATLSLLLGCSEISPSNPYDPSTPRAQQATGRVSGTLLAPAGVDRGVLVRAALALHDLAAPRTAPMTSQPDEAGAFTFEEVPAGSYEVRPTLEGAHLERALLVTVGMGAVVELGEIQLVAETATELQGGIRGLARRDHAEAERGGVVVRFVGRPWSTVTDADDHFEQRLPTGLYTLRFEAPGYGAVDLAEQRVVAGEVTEVPEVVLSGRAGRIRGAVAAPRGMDQGAFFLGVVIERWATDADISRDEPAAVAPPDVEGRFEFADVPVGVWRITARHVGYEVVPWPPIVVAPGETLDLGLAPFLEPPPPEAGPAPAMPRVEGLAKRTSAEGDDAHGGTRIEVVGTPYAALTTGEGRYQITVPPGAPSRSLRFVREGHGTEILALSELSMDEIFTAPEVMLTGNPGRIRGRVALPPGFDDAALLAAVSVELRRTGDSIEAPPSSLRQPDAEGRFLFEDVSAGTWRLDARLPGFEADALPFVDVSVGEVLDLGTMLLSARPGAFPVVGGRARLAGQLGENAHGGILVELVDSALATTTTSEGRFQLAVPPEHAIHLRFSHRQYGVAGLDLNALPVNAAYQVPPEQEVVLPVLPGAIRGRIRLAHFGDAEVLRTVDVAARVNDAVRVQVHPDAEGAFILSGIPPGPAELRISLPGFERGGRPVEMASGQELDVGDVLLGHQSDGDEAVSLEGRITLAGRREHGGTTVQVRFTDRDLPFRETLTRADGSFSVPASREERYRIFVSRPGFAFPPGGLGPVAYLAPAGPFRTEANQPIETELVGLPIEGVVQVRPLVAAWLPLGERWATVSLEGPNTRETRDIAALGPVTEFAVADEGTYFLTLSRAGFRTATRVVTLSSDAPIAAVGDVELELVDLATANLDLRSETLSACDLRAGMSLRRARLAGVELRGDFSMAGNGCPDAVVTGPLDLSGADLTGADLRLARFGTTGNQGVSLRGARLVGADLSGVDLRGVDATGADFGAARLGGAQLSRARLTDANLTSTDASGALFVERRQAGPDEPFSQRWPGLDVPAEPLPENPCDAGAERPGVRVDGAVFARTLLTGAFMPGIMLRGADFSGSGLTGADLRGACLQDANLPLLDLSGATLDDADLTGARLTASLLSEVSLRGATLDRASLVATILDRVDLRRSLRPACDGELPPLAEYGPGGECERLDVPASACRCRALARDTAFDGANLLGAVVSDADLSGSTMQNATFGTLPELSATQPDACPLEAVFGCLSLFELLGTCDEDPTMAMPLAAAGARAGFRGNGRWDDPDFWINVVCTGLTPLDLRLDLRGDGSAALDPEGPLVWGENSGQVALDAFASGGCRGVLPHFDAAIREDEREPPPVPESTWVPTCTYETLLEDFAQGRDLGSACETMEGHVVLPLACLRAPSTVRDSRLDGVTMTGTSLAGLSMNRVSFVDADLSGVVMRQATGLDLDLRRANLQGASLEGFDFTFADVRETDFRGALLDDARFHEARLGGVDFRGASLRRARLVTFDSTGRRPAPPREFMYPAPRLAGADLSGAVVLLHATHGGWSLSSESPDEVDRLPNLDGANLRGEFTGVVNADHLSLWGSCAGCKMLCANCFIQLWGYDGANFLMRGDQGLLFLRDTGPVPSLNYLRPDFAPCDSVTLHLIENAPLMMHGCRDTTLDVYNASVEWHPKPGDRVHVADLPYQGGGGLVNLSLSGALPIESVGPGALVGGSSWWGADLTGACGLDELPLSGFTGTDLFQVRLCEQWERLIPTVLANRAPGREPTFVACPDGTCPAFTVTPPSCDAQELGVLPMGGQEFATDTTQASDVGAAACNRGHSVATAYTFDLARAATVTAEMVSADYDTVLFVRSDCTDAGTEEACNDDLGGGPTLSRVEAVLSAGRHTLFVSGFDGTTGTGTLALTVSAP